MFLETSFSEASLTTAQRAFKNAMAKLPITIEWFFMKMKQLWGLVDIKQMICLGQIPAGLIQSASVVLQTCKTGSF